MGDLISRQAVLDALYELCDTGETLRENPWRDNLHIDVLVDTIEQLPSVNPKQTEITLESAIDYLHSIGWLQKHDKELTEGVKREPKTGHWILRPHIYGVAFCSECGFELKINNTNYCPNCGCRMVEPQESEDKE